MGEHRPTLVRPPPVDSSKAPIENALELTDLSIIGPDIFTNTRELWHPPGARGIYGGAVIAQTLAAAQRTVPADFVVHSYHCFFVLAGDSSIPIVYYVERVREGRSYCTRTVQARQRGHAIFTVTCSFMRERSGGAVTVTHSTPMPPAALANPPPDDYQDPGFLTRGAGARRDDPFQSFRCAPADADRPAHDKRVWQWVRARGKISEEGGHRAHLSALAYISDSFFIGTVPRIHRLWRYAVRPDELDELDPDSREHLERLNQWEGGYGPLEEYRARPRLGMMVSLDHSIYFHNPKMVKADEWMFTEMESPWSGDGRGVVMQRVWSREGVLLATAFQEGVVRLKDDSKEKKAKL
ncbi:Thioesterase/thiol ester dehydrase-isomerase [Annulohypoxylon bovei var. microspora]|nr:Thioesterase/thiol ester dehydrase-isomerase [Annulohypoxylon bovei var. microspora]